MMQRKVEAGLMDAVGTYFHHATDGLGPEIETYQNEDLGGATKRGGAIGTMSWLE